MSSLKTRFNPPRGRPAPTRPDPAQPGLSAVRLSSLERSTYLPALVSSGLLFASLPPFDLWPLAWIAPVFWVLLIRRRQLPGKHPYRALWLAGAMFWLAALHWLRLPHPATSLGWIALASYLGLYLPLWVALARVAVHRLHCPLALAAAVVWSGLELAQAHLLSGFNMGSIAHTQHHWLALLQIADLAGGYGVSFVVIYAAATLASIVPCEDRGWRPLLLVPVALLLAAVIGYGHLRLHASRPTFGPTIALIQGSIDTTVKSDPGEAETVFRQYFKLSQAACRSSARLDLVVWPETMFRAPYLTYDENAFAPPGEDWKLDDLQAAAQRNRTAMGDLSAMLDVPLLLGVDAIHFGPGTSERYNSALLVLPDGRLGPRYDKMHPVPFGEYVPLAKTLPWLYKLTPMAGGIECGTNTPLFPAGKARVAANICYESALSHVVRDQITSQCRRGEEPEVLVNLTNDGWFYGSSELDLHLICGVFRAIECRKPFLIAANTGFSAWIDANGRIVKQGKRHETDWIVAQVELDNRHSPYLAYGDWPAGLCLLACGGLALYGLADRWRAGKRYPAAAEPA